MDDLHLFASAKVVIPTKAYDDGYLSWRRHDHSSLDLIGVVATTATSHSTSVATSPATKVAPSQAPRPPQWPVSDRGQLFQSPWHQALERLEDRRRWRKTALELSSICDEWLAGWKTRKGGNADPRVVKDASRSGTEASVGVTLVQYSETKASTILKSSTIELREIPADEAGLDDPDVPNHHGVVQVIHEEVHERHKVDPIAVELPPNNGRNKGLPTIEHNVTTPERPQHITSSTTTTPLTPSSHRSSGSFEGTPDTPESALRTSRLAAKTSPESPLSQRIDRSDKPPAVPKETVPWGHPSLLGDPSSMQKWFAPTRLFPASHEDTRRTTRSPVSVRASQPKSSNGLLSSSQESIKPGRPLSVDKTFQARSSQVTVKREPGYTASVLEAARVEHHQLTNQSKRHEAFVHPKPTEGLTAQSTTGTTSTGAHPATAPKFANALAMYDEAVHNWYRKRNNGAKTDTRTLLEADDRRCFATAAKTGQRCRIWQVRGSPDSIRRTVESLEACNQGNNFENSEEFVEKLARLSRCEAQTWPGHWVNANQILHEFRVLKAESLSSVSKTSLSTFTAKPLLSHAFSGLEPWQPSGSNKDVSTTLRELIETPLDPAKENRSGYIYAYRAQGVFGFVKIGYTSRDIDIRMKEWEDKCGHTPEVVIGSAMRVPHVARVEKLIHAELKDCRRIQTKCPCGTIHIEWFETSHLTVKAVVEKWSAWMDSYPYDSIGRLDPRHREKSMKLCKTTVAVEDTKRGLTPPKIYVQSLERPFGRVGTPARQSLPSWG